MSGPLCSCIDTEERNTLAKLTIDIPATLLNIWARAVSNDKAWVLYEIMLANAVVQWSQSLGLKHPVEPSTLKTDLSLLP